jgi:hypothetical protein
MGELGVLIPILGILFVSGVSFAALAGAYAMGRLRGERDVVARGPVSLEERLARIEALVETTAIEVERVAESQRFRAKLDGQVR